MTTTAQPTMMIVPSRSDRFLRSLRLVGVLLCLGMADFVDRRVDKLSTGQKQKASIARTLIHDPPVLILDEPTNDLDLTTVRALEEALCAFHGCVILVSHDRWFLDRVATHVLHLDGQGGAFLHTGDMDSWMERSGPTVKTTASGSSSVESPPASSPSPTKLSYKEKRELEKLVARIADHEQRIAAIDIRLSDPKTYRQAAEAVADLRQDRSAAAADLETDMARWEQLATREDS